MSASTSHSQTLESIQRAVAVQNGEDTSVDRQERIELIIPDHQWEPVSYIDDLPSQLHAKVVVNGCSMHFEAYLVGEDGEIADLQQKGAITCMKKALRDDQSWQTILYEQRRYVLVAIPYGSGF